VCKTSENETSRRSPLGKSGFKFWIHGRLLESFGTFTVNFNKHPVQGGEKIVLNKSMLWKP